MRKFLKVCSEWQTTSSICHFGARNVDVLIGYKMKTPSFPPPAHGLIKTHSYISFGRNDFINFVAVSIDKIFDYK